MYRRLFSIFIGGCICVGQVDGKEAFQWKGELMLDQDHYGAIYQKDNSEAQSNSEIRRIKLGMDYYATSQVRAQLDLEASKQEKRDDGLELKDVWLRWRASQSQWRWTLGQFKEPLGHERLSGSGRLPLIERSMVSSAFSPGRSQGVSMEVKDNLFTFSSGVFKAEPEEDQLEQNDVWAWTSRMTQAWDLNNHFIHVGVGLSIRDLNDTLFQIEERGEVNSADNIIQGARFYADQQVTSQFEIAYQLSHLWLMAEYYSSLVSATDGDDWQYHGFYIQAVYGGHQKYKRGKFKGRAKSGEWEVALRYSGLDLRDNALGTEAGSFVVGVNYHFSKTLTLMLNHLRPTLSGNVVNSDLSGAATSARIKFRF